MNPTTTLSHRRLGHTALAVGLVALLSACTGSADEAMGSSADKVEINTRSTVVGAHQTYSFDLDVAVDESAAADGTGPFAQCAAGDCDSAHYLARKWCLVAAGKKQPATIASIVARTTGLPASDFYKYYGDDHERGGSFGSVVSLTPGGGATVHCSIAPAPRYVVANPERLGGVTRDYSAIDGATHAFNVPVSRSVAFSVGADGKSTTTYSAETQSVPLTIAFEPLRAPPTITPKYDELAKNGVVKVFVPSLAVCYPVDQAYAFMQLADADENMKQYRASLTAAGYREVEADAPDVSQTLTNGQGWSLLFEKTVGSGKVEVRVAGPANNLDPARRERVKQWNREATIALPVRGNYYHPTCTELAGTAPPDRYRVELLRGLPRSSWEEFDVAILSESATPPSKAETPFTSGDRLWLQYYDQDRPWREIDALAAGAFGGPRPTANQLVTDLAPALTIDLGGN